jgi:protein-S-isoprenylcysteine O-methyltransferase Ste14
MSAVSAWRDRGNDGTRMSRIAAFIVAGLWLSWLVYWLVAARTAKATLRRETPWARALHVGPLFLCAILLSFPRLAPPPLGRRFLPDDILLAWLGVALVACGLAFAIWARQHLGGNWSGTVALKSGHTLIRSGPYALVRHPIYSGLLLAILGSVVRIGEWRTLIGFALALFAIMNRVKAEDALMQQAFGAQYRDYWRGTPALLPFLM